MSKLITLLFVAGALIVGACGSAGASLMKGCISVRATPLGGSLQQMRCWNGNNPVKSVARLARHSDVGT